MCESSGVSRYQKPTNVSVAQPETITILQRQISVFGQLDDTLALCPRAQGYNEVTLSSRSETGFRVSNTAKFRSPFKSPKCLGLPAARSFSERCLYRCIKMKGIWSFPVHLTGASFSNSYVLARIIIDIVFFVLILFSWTRLKYNANIKETFYKIRFGAHFLLLYVIRSVPRKASLSY
jgi:hypothetical protein